MYFRHFVFCFVLLVEIFVVGVQPHTEFGATSSKNKGKKLSVSLHTNKVFILVNSTACESTTVVECFVECAVCLLPVNDNNV